MQTIYTAIKNYLLNNTEFFTAEGLPAPVESDFYFGVADLMKQKGSLIIAVVPQNENEYDNDNDLTEYQKISEIVVSFICRNNRQSILNDKVAKYARAFRKAILTDNLLDDSVDNCILGERKYYLDAGTVEMQMSAVECDLQVVTHDTID